jgi:hypothetical protein
VRVEAPDAERCHRGEEHADEQETRPTSAAPSPLDGLEYAKRHHR